MEGEESELGLFNESSGLCTVAEIRLPQTAVLVAEGLGGLGGACLTCCNQKELTGKWIKRVKSLMAFWSKRDVLPFNAVEII